MATKWEELSVSEQTLLANLRESVKSTCSACDALERKGLAGGSGNTEAGWKILEDAEKRGFIKRIHKDDKTFWVRLRGTHF
jgi:hypothetical protein